LIPNYAMSYFSYAKLHDLESSDFGSFK